MDNHSFTALTSFPPKVNPSQCQTMPNESIANDANRNTLYWNSLIWINMVHQNPCIEETKDNQWVIFSDTKIRRLHFTESSHRLHLMILMMKIDGTHSGQPKCPGYNTDTTWLTLEPETWRIPKIRRSKRIHATQNIVHLCMSTTEANEEL